MTIKIGLTTVLTLKWHFILLDIITLLRISDPSSANKNAGCSLIFTFQINNEWFLEWEYSLYIQMSALFLEIQIHRAVLYFILAPLFRIWVTLQGIKLPSPPAWVLSTHFSSTSPVSELMWDYPWAHVCYIGGREWVQHFHRVRTCGGWLGSCSMGSGDTALKEKAPGPQSATYPPQTPGLLGYHQSLIAF